MALDKDPLNLIITGVGGQGNVLASQIVASAGIKEGLYVTVGETYGASQRGGAVMSHVRFSARAQCSPLISEGQADIVVGLEPVEALRVMAGVRMVGFEDLNQDFSGPAASGSVEYQMDYLVLGLGLEFAVLSGTVGGNPYSGTASRWTASVMYYFH